LIVRTASIGYAAICSSLDLLIVADALGIAGVTDSDVVPIFEFIQACVLKAVSKKF
jgi:hypothetical protein